MKAIDDLADRRRPGAEEVPTGLKKYRRDEARTGTRSGDTSAATISGNMEFSEMKKPIGMLVAIALLLFSGAACADELEYHIYMPDSDGEQVKIGHETVDRDGDRISGKQQLAWGNRRVHLEMSFTLGDNQIPSRMAIEGINLFGAPVDEKFIFESGISTWESTNESGSAETTRPIPYVPNVSSTIVTSLLVRTLLADEDHSVDVLPQGQMRLETLDQLVIEEGERKETVYLYAISGLDLIPEFGWYDKNGDLFAWDEGGFISIWRAGWDRTRLEALKQRQAKAAETYLQELAREHTHVSPAPILLTHVDLADVETGTLLKDHNLLVEDGKIARISASPIQIENATRIDAHGMTLMPGLWDMHGHIGPEGGILNMAAGVINMRDPGSGHEIQVRTAGAFASGQAIGGKHYGAGFIDGDDEYASRDGKVASSLDDAVDAVDWYAERGYSLIKTYSSMKPEWMAPLAEHIHDKGMRLAGHIPAFMTAEQAVDAGFDEVTHINMLFLNFMGPIDTRQKLRFSEVGEHAHELDLDNRKVSAFLDKLAANSIVVDPTVTAFRSMLLGRPGSPNPEFSDVIDHLPVNVSRQFLGATLDVKPEHRDDYDKSAEALLHMLRKLHDHKVRMVAGTDTLEGLGLLRELELYARAGIPNAAVLRTATLEPARVAGALETSGSIAVGKDADLILLDGNPLDDISALRRTALVIEGQNLYRPDELFRAIGIKPFHESVDFDIATVTATSTPEVVQAPPLEGTDYEVIPGGQPFETGTDKIEVVEFFSYHCPSCARFQPLVDEWKSNLPEDVNVVRVPTVWTPVHETYARAFYAAKALGLEEQTHDAVYRAIHIDRTLKGARGIDSMEDMARDGAIDTPEDIARFYQAYGANPAQFIETVGSAAVDGKLDKARQYEGSSGVEGTPTLIVAGKYRITGTSLKDHIGRATPTR